jgi:hypothetical protein
MLITGPTLLEESWRKWGQKISLDLYTGVNFGGTLSTTLRPPPYHDTGGRFVRGKPPNVAFNIVKAGHSKHNKVLANKLVKVVAHRHTILRWYSLAFHLSYDQGVGVEMSFPAVSVLMSGLRICLSTDAGVSVLLWPVVPKGTWGGEHLPLS